MSDTITVSNVQANLFSATPSLRWAKVENPEAYLSPPGIVVDGSDNRYILQQAWQCMMTGEVEWREIPFDGVVEP